ncbi:class I SAM-dependent methyltransferase [Fluviicola sp.]|uniref:class I SAM-dependent methyltransferase n=1 Tax=Fluviicola sp. TaxID=1917219 RepID=UPI003D2AD68F
MEELKIASFEVSTCFVCNSQGKSKYINLNDPNYGTSKGWNIVECSNSACGLMWLNPMPTVEEIGKAYESYYTHEQQKKPAYELSFLEKSYWAVAYNYFPSLPLLKKIPGYLVYLLPINRNKFDFKVLYLNAVPKGRILDFGCGNGSLLDNLSVLGWECYGLDFDSKAVDFCKEKGLNVNLGDISSQDYPDNFFDAITINHVIEHVHEVDDLIKSCYQKLKKGGRLIIATPNTKNWQRGLYKRNWFQLDPPRHLHLFNPNNLEVVIKRNQFDVLQSFTSVRMDAWSTTVSKALKRNGRFVIGKDKKRMSDFMLGVFHQNMSVLFKLFNRQAAGEIILIATKK